MREETEPAGSYACLAVRTSGDRRDETDRALVRIARTFSPRVEPLGAGRVVLAIDGLERRHGQTHAIGDALRRAAADRRLTVAVGIAATRVAAIVMATARTGVTVVPPGTEAASLAPLPLDALESLQGTGPRGAGWARVDTRDARRQSRHRHYRLAPSPASMQFEVSGPRQDTGSGDATVVSAVVTACRTVRRWGLRTLGELAALPSGELFERLGSIGTMLQRLARGQDLRPLVSDPGEPRFEQSLELEWPIDCTEPLAFALTRVLEPLCDRLERHDRGVAVLHLRLRLVTRARYERSLDLPIPLRDLRTLRTLILLDLESHPPPAGIDELTVAVDPALAPVVRFSLLDRVCPAPEALSTLLARLRALMGENRCGAPVLPNSHRPGAMDLQPFWVGPAPVVSTGVRSPPGDGPDGCAVVRRFRVPLDASVQMSRGQPASVGVRGLGSGGRVVAVAGPWRTSGEWWREAAGEAQARWDRDEWDVALSDGGIYRLSLDRDTGRWFVDGLVD